VASALEARDRAEDAMEQYGAHVLTMGFLRDCAASGVRPPEERYVAIKSAVNKAPPMSGAPERCSSIRLFVSSTFVDMVREREVLLSRVFPSICATLEQRDASFFVVDLRWGVDGSTPLPVCLDQIAQCNYFLGVIGQRYGHVPDAASVEEARNAFPGLPIEHGMSITEIECRLFRFLEHRETRRSLFYVRDPAAAPAATTAAESREASSRRNSFQEWLRLQCNASAYRDEEDLAGVVAQSLARLIDVDCPPIMRSASAASELDQHLHCQRMFVGSRQHLLTPDENKWLSYLMESRVRSHSGRPLVLYSPDVGSAISTALCCWLLEARSNASRDTVFLTHFVGTTLQRAVRFWLLELQRIFGWDKEEVPDDDESSCLPLLQLLVAWLRSLCALGQRFVVVLDNLQDLQEDGVLALRALPELPPQVSMVVGVSGRALADALRDCWGDDALVAIRLGWDDERLLDFCASYLRKHGKVLSAEQRAILRSCPAHHRYPLFLSMVLEYVRIHASYESVNATLTELLQTTGLDELVGAVLMQHCATFGRPLVAAVCSALCSARAGLTMREISYFGAAHGDWRSFIHAANKLFIERGGWLSPVHGALRDACLRLFGPAHSQLQQMYREAQKFSEMCYHVCQEGNMAALQVALANSDVVVVLSADELFRYCKRLGNTKNLEAGLSAVVKRCSNAVTQARVALACGQVAVRLGSLSSGSTLLQVAARLSLGMGVEFGATALLAYGQCLLQLGETSKCIEVARQMKDVCGGDAWQALSLHSHALKKASEFGEALELCRAAYTEAARVHTEHHPVLGALIADEADLLRKQGNLSLAQTTYTKAEAILETSYSRTHPQLLGVLRGNALCAKKRGLYLVALGYYDRCMKIVVDSYGEGHPLRAKLLGDMADAQRKLEDFSGALAAYKDALALLKCNSHGASIEAGELLHGIALVEKKLGHYAEAEDAERRALALVEALHGPSHYKYGVWWCALGDIVRKRGNIQQALDIYRGARLVLRRTLEETHDEISMADLNIALCLKKLARYDEASQLYASVIKSLSAVFGDGHYKVALALSQHADVMRKQKRNTEALAVYCKAEEIFHSQVGFSHQELTDVHLGKAVLLTTLGRLNDAEAEIQKGMDIVERSFGLTHYKRGLFMNRLGEVLLARKDRPNALIKFSDALQTLEVSLGGDHVECADVVMNLAELDAARRTEHLTRALGIYSRELGADHPKVAQVRAALEAK
jgi:tetratricopeptide (TPR) repeat protein